MCQASFLYFPFKVREYRSCVYVGWGGVYFAQGHTLEKEETESARGDTQSNFSGKRNGGLGWQASLHLMGQACSRCCVCVCVCDQMHTGDLDKVQPLSTCYVTNEIILEPAVCSADISETVQRLLMNHGSQFCLLAHHTRQGSLSMENSSAGHNGHGYWSLTMCLGKWLLPSELTAKISRRVQSRSPASRAPPCAPLPQASLCIVSLIVLDNKTFAAKFANSLNTIHSWLSGPFYLAHIELKKKINLN